MTQLYYAEAGAGQAPDFQEAYMQDSPKLRILLSYHYYKDINLDELLEKKFAPHYPDIFIDSGGYSAMTQGATINIAEYCAFIQRFKHRITTYASLDVIGDAEASWKNQQEMEAAGLAPIPVFHAGEDWSYLERYIERYPYIALGGMVPYMKEWKKLLPWIIRAFKMAGDRSVYHGFGCTSWNVISRIPWYSVDSSSWAAAFRFGKIALFDDVTGKWSDAQLGDLAGCRKLAKLFQRYGYSADDFGVRERNQRKQIAGISAMAYIRAERYLQKRHGEIKMPERESGAKMYGVSTCLSLVHQREASTEVHGAQLFLADAAPNPAKDSAMASAEIHAADEIGARVYLSDTSNTKGGYPIDAQHVHDEIHKEEH